MKLSFSNLLRFLLFCFLFFAAQGRAHESGTSYLTLNIEENRITGRWAIGLPELAPAIGLDLDRNGVVSLAELRAGQSNIHAYASSRLQIKADGILGVIRFTDTEPMVERSLGESNLVLTFVLSDLQTPRILELDYRLLFDIKPQHRGLLRLEYAGQTQTAIFTADIPVQRFELGARSPGKEFLAFGWQGVLHIWTGIDHILFLLALLLPAVLYQEERAWRAVRAFRPAFLNVVKIVTAFTVAHSLTLSLASLQIIQLPSRWVESAIAGSVLLAAANNVWTIFRGRVWVVAFGFGLVHGFGFASVLAELGLPRRSLVVALVAFNLGVEAGQLAIVSLFLPFAYGMRTSRFYQYFLLRLGSGLVALVAGIWLVERIFDVKFLPI